MMATSGYRPDVDGLRTIAVTAVVIYHAFPGSLTGGYVGVDVFFVVSGFLITSVIVDDLERGRFSIVDYYGRRARRILPALIVMVLAGLAVGAIILFPGDFQDLARSTAATALFLSNVWFWLDRQDYFADAVEFAPLLHTWSLAVEEQFYIVAPLLLALVLRHGRGPAIVAMSAICAAALALSAATSAGSHGFAFYLPLTRAYELGLGALLALVPASRLSLPRSAREAAAASGLAMIIVAVFAFDGATVFPGVAALLPCVGTALVIAAGSQGQTVVGGLLSLGPLVFVGLVSYSWYLWHWPVLAFTRVHLGTVDLPPSVALSAVAGSFGLAVLSWRFVEQPFRRRRGVIAPGTGAFAASAAGIAALVAAAAMVELGGGLPQRFASEVVAVLDGPRHWRHEPGIVCEEDAASGIETCRSRSDAASAGKDYILMGDSHAGTLAAGLLPALAREGLSGEVVALTGCPPLLDVWRSGPRGVYANCARHNEAFAASLEAREDAGVIILHARWPLVATGKRMPSEAGGPVRLRPAGATSDAGLDNLPVMVAGLRRMVERVRATGRRVVIVGSVPEIGWNVPRAKARMLAWQAPVPPVPDASLYDPLARGSADHALAGLAAGDPGVTFVPVVNTLCTPDCQIVDGKIPLYRDDDHLSVRGVEVLLSRLKLAAMLDEARGRSAHVRPAVAFTPPEGMPSCGPDGSSRLPEGHRRDTLIRPERCERLQHE